MTPNVAVPHDVCSAILAGIQITRQLQTLPLRENASYDVYPGESVDNMNSMSQEIYDIHKEAINKKLDSLTQDMREVKKDISDMKVYIGKLDVLIASNQAMIEKLDARLARMDARIEKLDSRLWWIVGLVVASILAPVALKFWP
jgi:peptidoglycan hydrolase CwlO-like protein